MLAHKTLDDLTIGSSMHRAEVRGMTEAKVPMCPIALRLDVETRAGWQKGMTKAAFGHRWR
jgi:hypothetical protein